MYHQKIVNPSTLLQEKARSQLKKKISFQYLENYKIFSDLAGSVEYDLLLVFSMEKMYGLCHIPSASITIMGVVTFIFAL